MTVAINNIAFWDMMRCGLMIIYWCFGGKRKKFCQTICHNIPNHPEKLSDKWYGIYGISKFCPKILQSFTVVTFSFCSVF